MLRSVSRKILAATGVAFGSAMTGAAELPLAEPRAAESRTSAFAYVGKFSDGRFDRILRMDTNFKPSWVGVVGVTRVLTRSDRTIRMEGEVNLAQHWGMQRHQEVNAALTARWTRFPWDDFLDTSVALGSGPSLAFRRPPIEERPERRAALVLVYMLFEIEGSRPEWAGWSGFARVHHRSGFGGWVSRAEGSNFVGVGVRRRM